MAEEHGIRATVDRAACVGNGVCVALAPRAFALDDMMKAVVLDSAAETEQNLFEAARACPSQAIYLSTDGASLYP